LVRSIRKAWATRGLICEGVITSSTYPRSAALLKMILAVPQPPRESIAELATATDWTLPDQLAVIALEYRDDQYQLPATALGPQVLVDLESAEPCLVVAEPEIHLTRLASELRGRRAAVGPTAPLADARHSLRCARTALTLVQRRALPQQPITWCRDHLSTLLLLQTVQFGLAQQGLAVERDRPVVHLDFVYAALPPQRGGSAGLRC
jgi:hypothetical protein